MRAKGEFVFKCIEKKNGGKFVNDKGQEVEYNEKYQLKVDEVTPDGSINERKFNVDINNLGLVDRLKKLKPYEKITLECDILMYNTSAKVVPIALCDSNNK